MLSRLEVWGAFVAMCVFISWQLGRIDDRFDDLGTRIDRMDTRLTREMVGVQNQIVATEVRLSEQMSRIAGTFEHRISRLETFHLTAKTQKSK